MMQGGHCPLCIDLSDPTTFFLILLAVVPVLIAFGFSSDRLHRWSTARRQSNRRRRIDKILKAKRRNYDRK